MQGAWPLVGRDDEIDLVQGAVGRGASVVIAGAAGVGKTRLAQEVLDRLESQGHCVVRAVASEAARAMPFGALAQLLPGDAGPFEGEAASLRRGVAALRRLGGDGPAVLSIDDAHNLDDASAVLVHQAVHSGVLSAVLTVRTGTLPPDPIQSLWKDHLAERVELQALAAAEVGDLIKTHLGAQIDGYLLEQLWKRSEGNPLFLRELLLEARNSSAIVKQGGIWRLTRPLPPSERLIELIEFRLAGIDVTARRLLELLAIGEELGFALLENKFGTDLIERMESAGAVTIGEDRRRRPVRLAHPLYGEVLRTVMPTTRARNVMRDLAVLTETSGRRRRGDTSRVALWRLEADGSADPELLTQAAREAMNAYAPALVVRFGSAAIDAGAGAPARWLLGEVLRWLGRRSEAEEVLGGAVDMATDEERALIAVARAWNLADEAHAYDETFRVLEEAGAEIADPVWRDELSGVRAQFIVMAGDVDEAMRIVRPILEGPQSRASTLATVVGSLALTARGRYDEAARLCEAGLMATTTLPEHLTRQRAGLNMIARCSALIGAGRLAEAQAVGDLLYQVALDAGLAVGQAWFALIRAQTGVATGRLRLAEEQGREAATLFRDLRYLEQTRWSLALATLAAAGRGDGDAARALADDLASIRTAGHLYDTEISRANAWAAIASGERTRGVEILLEAGARAAEAGMFGFEALCLHDVVRLGQPELVVGRFDQLIEVVEGRLVRARRDHADALFRSDPAALLDAADAFCALGAYLPAAEAAAQAAGVARASGDPRRANAAAARADELRARCEGPRTPALLALAEERVPLTKREREVATLAALGASSRDIADRLVLSVRTVENHLQRTYEKLGVSGRAELSRHPEFAPSGSDSSS